jgi:hypothetical protein
MKVIIIYLTVFFIIFEILKLIFLPVYWKISLKRRDYPVLVIIETLYLLFLVFLTLMGFWYIGLCMLIISIITAFQIMDDVMERTKFNKQIRKHLFADGIISIIFLLIVILKELLK